MERDESRSGSLNLALLASGKRVALLRNRCVLGGSKYPRMKSKVATSALLSRGPQCERHCYVAPAFSKVAMRNG